MIYRNLVRILIIAALAGIISCEENGGTDLTTEFNYPAIINREYSNYGRTIPLTIDQGIENDGAVTADGRYFFYSSDREGGNFDIYLRGMRDIVTARIISHPGKDTSPAVSPDGKSLAFVSNREDPEGDIYVVSLNPKSVLNSAKKTLTHSSSLDRRAKNVTLYQHPETKTIMIVRDANPSWSPDGDWIAFSSRREGEENIWIMNDSGKKMRRLTEKGGLYPSFSPDGKEIAFVSYREPGSNGDIYTVNIETGEERRITSGPAIDLYPSFASDNFSIIFSRIEKDSNGDGKLDLNDRSFIVFMDIESGHQYPLTSGKGSSFNARWTPAFKSDYGQGVIVYSELIDGNININMMPDSGIIPARKNAVEQLDLAAAFQRDVKDDELFMLAVDRVFYNFHKDDSPESIVSVSRSLIYGWEKSTGRDRERYYNRLKDYSAAKAGYSEAAFLYLEAVKLKGDGLHVLERYLDKFKTSETEKTYVPYVMEDIAEIYLRTKRYDSSEKIYAEIIAAFPDLVRINHLKRNYLQAYTGARGKLPEDISGILDIEDYKLRTRMKLELHRFFLSVLSKSGGKELVAGYRETFKDNLTLSGIIELAVFEHSAAAGSGVQARTALENLLKNAPEADRDIVYYRSCMALGDHYTVERDRPGAEAWYYEGIINYKREWTDNKLGDKLKLLMSYYEEFGERAHYAGKYAESTALYKKYSEIMSRVSSIREFNELYNMYAPRAHILYIDEYIRLKGAGRLGSVQKDYEKNQIRAQIEFDKAFIYGLGYIYLKRGMAQERKKEDDSGDPVGIKGLVEYLSMAVSQTDWAVFLDDTFVEPYILKSYIYQYMDLKRLEDDSSDDIISRVFPRYLWEKNISILERALAINDESASPENEGAIHLNMANNYYLLNNYPRAQTHYQESKKYKNRFGSQMEEALFHFHLSQCFWNNGKPDLSREQLQITFNIYESLAAGKNRRRFSNQFFTIYKYFALMLRSEGKYQEAINWYIRILEFASANKLKIDRARFLQEIGHCYMELEDYDRALSYIDQAGRQLKKYPDIEKKYNLRIRILERWTLKSYDLGPDAAVIGENKIFSSLGKIDKQALNLALLEEVYFRKNSYTKAQDFLTKKIELHEKRGLMVDKESAVVALNNSAYYSVLMKKYADAEKKYIKARKIAAGSQNLEGEFRSIINLTSLYSYIVDNGIKDIKNISKAIENLIEEIEDYKKSFKEEKYKIEYETLAATSKARGVEVVQADLDQLKIDIDAEAEEIYFTIGISRGILEFYRAEILKPATYPVSEKIKDAKKYYEKPSELFALYSSALNLFSASLEAKHQKLTGDLKIRILLNAAEASYSLGLNDRSAAYLKEAVDLAVVYDIPVLKMNAYLAKARFEINRGGDTAEAGANLEKAAQIVEEYPVFFASGLKKVRELYDLTALYNLRAGRNSEAFAASEKYCSVARVNLMYLSGIDFGTESENLAYEKYISAFKAVDNAVAKRTSLLNAGEPADSELSAEALKSLVQSKAAYKTALDSIVKSDPSLAPYVRPMKPSLQPPAGSAVVRLISGRQDYQAMILKDGRVAGEKFDSAAALAARLKEFAASETRYYIILEETMIYLYKNSLIDLNGFYTVNSTTDIQRFKNNSAPLVTSLYFTGTGMKKILEPEGIAVTEGGKNNDLSSYSVIVDAGSKTFLSKMNIFGDGSGGSAVDNADLFSGRKVRPLLIVKEIADADADYMRLFLEGALYSGASAVIFAKGGNAVQYASILKDYLKGSPPATVDPAKKVLAGGHPFIASGGGDLLTDAAEKERRLYTEKLTASDFDEAVFRLNRWRDLARTRVQKELTASQGETPADTGGLDEILREYYLNLADLLVYSEKYDEAFKTIEAGSDLLPEADSRREKFDSLKAYLLIQTGELKKADEIITKYLSVPSSEISTDAAAPQGIKDFHAMKAVLKSISEFSETSYADFSSILNDGVFYINRLRLAVLYSSVVNAAGFEVFALSAVKSAAAAYPDQPRSVRDSVYLNYMTGLRSTGTFTMRLKRIFDAESSSNMKISGSGALQMALVNNGFDSVSVFPVASAIRRAINDSDLNAAQNIVENINASDLAESAGWADAAAFMRLVESVYTLNELYENSLETLAAESEILKPLADVSPEIMKNHYYRYGLAYVSAGDYDKASDMFLAADKLFQQRSGRGFISNTMMSAFCDIRLKRADSAVEKLNSIVAEKPEASESFILKLLAGSAAADKFSGRTDLPDADFEEVNRHYNEAFNFFNNSSARKYVSTKAIETAMDDYIRLLAVNGRFGRAVAAADMKRSIISSVVTSNSSLKIDSTVDMDLFRSRLGESDVYLFFMKLGDDILILSADRAKYSGSIIPGAAPALSGIMDDYTEALSRLTNTLQVSIKMNELFKPLQEMVKDKKRVIISTDSHLEDVPFELIGERELLDERYSVVYSSTLNFSLAGNDQVFSGVVVAGEDSTKVFKSLETAALKRLGIYKPAVQGQSRPYVHYYHPLTYNYITASILSRGAPFASTLTGAQYALYLPAVEFYGAGINDLVILGKGVGAEKIVVNDSYMHDVNNAVFVENYYRNLRKGAGVLKAFEEAKISLKSRRAYKHPAYWAGIRLYLN
jgi:TolB protein